MPYRDTNTVCIWVGCENQVAGLLLGLLHGQGNAPFFLGVGKRNGRKRTIRLHLFVHGQHMPKPSTPKDFGYILPASTVEWCRERLCRPAQWVAQASEEPQNTPELFLLSDHATAVTLELAPLILTSANESVLIFSTLISTASCGSISVP